MSVPSRSARDVSIRAVLRGHREVRRWLIAVVVLAVGLTTLFALFVPAGQPYDEPSHWNTLEFYADQQRLPEIGEPGTSYQAQMGPVAYSVGGAIVLATESLTDEGFLVVRLSNVALVAAVVLLTYVLAMLVEPRRPRLAVGAAAFMGVTPTVVAFSGSVQNDTLALVLSLAAAVAVTRVLVPRPPGVAEAGVGWWVAVGVLVALATLTKVQTVTLVPAVAVAVLAARAPRRRALLPGAVVALLVVAVGTGWWFVRNIVLYGDLTARNGLTDAGYYFPARTLDAESIVQLGGSVVSTLWVPTEYYRNAFEAPLALRGGAVVLTIAAVVAAAVMSIGFMRKRRPTSPDDSAKDRGQNWRDQPERVFLVAWVLVTVAAWLVLVFASSDVSARVLAVVAAPVVILFGAALGQWRSRGVPGMVVVAPGLVAIGFAVLVDIWILTEVVQIPPQPFWIPGVT